MPKKPDNAKPGNIFDAASVQKLKITDSAPLRPFTIRSKHTLVLVARALIVNHLDTDAAVRMMFPRDTQERQIQTAEYLDAHPDVQVEIEDQLKVIGLDGGSKDAYIKEMWTWMWSQDNELKQTAARILSKAFMPEKADEQPKMLPIKGIEAGLKRMGLGEEDAAIPLAPIKDTSNVN